MPSFRSIAAALPAVLLSPSVARACDVCYDRSRLAPNAMIEGTRTGILFMLALIAVLLAGFGGLFAFWGWRASHPAEPDPLRPPPDGRSEPS